MRKNKKAKASGVFVVFTSAEVLSSLAETHRQRFMDAGFAHDGRASMVLDDDVFRITQTEVYTK